MNLNPELKEWNKAMKQFKEVAVKAIDTSVELHKKIAELNNGFQEIHEKLKANTK